MACTQIAQWIDAIGSLGSALLALIVLLYFEIFIANKRRREERSALIKAAMDEAILNEDFARHNVRTVDYGGWAFIHQRVSSCMQAFHAGTFDIDDDTRTIIRGYVESVEHVNSIMRSVELVSLYKPADTGSINDLKEAIKRYCSGKMDPQFDKDSKSLLDHIDKFRKELETKFKKELM